MAELKRVAGILGRPPTRDEYLEHADVTRQDIERVFGGYSILLKAAGMEISRSRKKKKDPFVKDLTESTLKPLESVQPHSVLETKPNPRIALFGDLHLPFTDMRCLQWAIQRVKNFKPDYIIQLGDLYDLYAQSKFARSYDVYTPESEIRIARGLAESFWEEVHTAAPLAQCYQILGNHDFRPFKRILESYPEGQTFFNVHQFYEFPGVELIRDPRQELIIGNWAFIHGFYCRPGQHRDHVLMNIALGHTHLGGVWSRYIEPIISGVKLRQTITELNAGYMGDPSAKCFNYTPQRFQKWTKGMAEIDEFGARFIPF